jgi:hairy-and-enhancer-of-split protein
MKPLLERKRRARINKCLDELKDIMTAALQAQGENVSKLEKADILELTVRHLHKMQQARRLMSSASRNPLEEIHRFQAGYSSCAQEAASFLLSTPGVDISVGQRLMAHLTSNIANPVASAVHSR